MRRVLLVGCLGVAAACTKDDPRRSGWQDVAARAPESLAKPALAAELWNGIRADERTKIEAALDGAAREPRTAEGIRSAAQRLVDVSHETARPDWAGSGPVPTRRAVREAGRGVLGGLVRGACGIGKDDARVREAIGSIPLVAPADRAYPHGDALRIDGVDDRVELARACSSL